MSSSPFHLDKWYLDAVTDGGLCVIAYRALLRYRSLCIRYAAALVSRPDEPVESRSTLRGTAEPTLDSGRIRWSAPALGVGFDMAPAASIPPRVLLNADSGEIIWHVPAQAACIRLDLDGRVHDAIGYAERLTTTIPPQHLPIRTLRWGRVVS